MENEIILQAITGSRAYGLDTETSDTDRIAIFVAPTTRVAGLGWNGAKETWSNAGPEGDDTTLHEIGKFLRLVIKGNPTLLEVFFMNEYEVLTEIGEALVQNSYFLLSTDTVFYSYYNYAKAQIRMVREREDYKPKMARHAMRLARQGCQLLETGECNVNVGDPAEYFELTSLPKETMLAKLETELEKMKVSHGISVLQDRPGEAIAGRLLQRVRINNMLKEIAVKY